MGVPCTLGQREIKLVAGIDGTPIVFRKQHIAFSNAVACIWMIIVLAYAVLEAFYFQQGCRENIHPTNDTELLISIVESENRLCYHRTSRWLSKNSLCGYRCSNLLHPENHS